jgi:threonine aldolase
MVFATLKEDVMLDSSQLAQRMLEYRVRIGLVSKRRFRLVTHYWVDDAGVDQALQAFRRVF